MLTPVLYVNKILRITSMHSCSIENNGVPSAKSHILAENVDLFIVNAIKNIEKLLCELKTIICLIILLMMMIMQDFSLRKA